MPDQDDVLWVDASAVLAAVADARMALLWNDRVVELPAVNVGHRMLDAAVDRVATLFLELPGHFIDELTDGFDAIARVAVEAQVADGVDETG